MTWFQCNPAARSCFGKVLEVGAARAIRDIGRPLGDDIRTQPRGAAACVLEVAECRQAHGDWCERNNRWKDEQRWESGEKARCERNALKKMGATPWTGGAIQGEYLW